MAKSQKHNSDYHERCVTLANIKAWMGSKHTNLNKRTVTTAKVGSSQVSTDRRTDEEDEMYICTMEQYSAIREDETLPRATRMDLESSMLRERSQRKTNTL